MKKLFTVYCLGILLLGFIITTFPHQSLADTMSFRFAKQFENGVEGYSQAFSVTLDETGNIYTTGNFSGTVDFDPSEGVHELTSSNDNSSSFISILANDGSFIGAYQLGDGEYGYSTSRSITLDEIDNIYTAGSFSGTVDFDPSEGVYELASSNDNQSSFISILANDGSFIGAYKIGDGQNGSSRVYSIALDEIGNIYMTGSFYGTVDFDPSVDTIHELTSSNDSSFISILANDGSFIGAYQFENGQGGYSMPSSITLDEIGNIYTAGFFGGTVDFDPSEGVYELTSATGSSFFSISANEGSFIGAYQFGNGDNGDESQSNSITLDNEGNIYNRKFLWYC